MSMQLHLQSVPAKNGQFWIRHGFKVFRRQPLALASLCGLSMVFGVLSGLIPMVGPVVGLMAVPLFSLGFMLATHLVLQHKMPTAAVFLEPLRLTPQRRKSQLILCSLFALCALLIMLAADAIDGDLLREAMDASGKAIDPDSMANILTDPRLIWGWAVRLGGLTLLAIPYWHAPALVHWGGQGAAQALFSSTLAVWRNKGAFLYNGLLWLGLMMVVSVASATVLDLLGLARFAPQLLFPVVLVLAAVFYASLYFSFVDCFMFGAPKNVLDEQA